VTRFMVGHDGAQTRGADGKFAKVAGVHKSVPRIIE